MSVGTGLFVSYPSLEDLGRSLNLCLSFFTCEVGIFSLPCGALITLRPISNR